MGINKTRQANRCDVVAGFWSVPHALERAARECSSSSSFRFVSSLLIFMSLRLSELLRQRDALYLCRNRFDY